MVAASKSQSTVQILELSRTHMESIRDVDQLNSVDGKTYRSILPQPSVWQFGLIKRLGLLKGFRGTATESTFPIVCAELSCKLAGVRVYRVPVPGKGLCTWLREIYAWPSMAVA